MQVLAIAQRAQEAPAHLATRWRPFVQVVAEYGAALVLCLLILAWSMRLWDANLHIPFWYEGDALVVQTYIKTGMENRWYWHNDCLGAPAALDLQDYPAEVSASFFFLLIKLLSTVVRDSAVAMNLFYLAGFPLVACSALFVLRSFRIGFGPALVIALLYAFIPYHFYQGGTHLFLASYFIVPFAVMLALWLYQDEPPFFRWNHLRQRLTPTVRGKRSSAGLALSVLIGSSQIYYAYFSCLLWLVAGASSSLYKRRLYPLASALVLVAIVTVVSAINLSPVLAYQWKHGRNPGIKRFPAQAEQLGLKIVQILLPIDRHRLGFWARLKERYNGSAPLCNENGFSNAGIVAASGFLLLLGRLFHRRQGSGRLKLMDQLSMLNTGAVLLGTMGGFGSVISYTVTPWFRAYCRLGIFIGFFALFAVGVLLDKLMRRYTASERYRLMFFGILTALLAVAVLDQTGESCVPAYVTNKQRYEADAELIEAIEASVPCQARIFQLPYATFPDDVTGNSMRCFDHLRGYLHSKRLRWSYPAMFGRETDAWQRTVVLCKADKMVRRLLDAGFSGILINRDGYGDRSLEAALTRITCVSPLESSHKQLAFFSLEKLTWRHNYK